MRNFIVSLFAALLLAPTLAGAGLRANDLPGTSTWYIHVDLEEMRDSSAGKGIYKWLDRKVFRELQDELGVDFDDELNQLTAYGLADASPIILLEGPISQKFVDKMIDAAEVAGDIETHESRNKTYYYFEDHHHKKGSRDVKIDSFEDGVYFSAALKDKIIVTPSLAQMESMLANGGLVIDSEVHPDGLFVLSAERDLVQAGADTEKLNSGHDHWDSKLLRNTKKVALLLADVGDRIAIDISLEAVEPGMVNSLANIARGLIGLTAFSDDIDPEIAALLRGTDIDVDDNVLKINVVVDPDEFVSILRD